MLKTITKEQYLQVVGLMTVGSQYMQRLEDIEKSLRAVFEVQPQDSDTSGVGSPDHIGDAIYSKYTPDELLGKLGIPVPDLFAKEEDRPCPPPNLLENAS